MQSKIPLYYSVMESIKDDIILGKYPVGSFLPTENELETLYNVSKITIRKAIELLENDGFVIKKSGFGTTVLSNSLYNKLSKSASFSHVLKEQGFNLTKKKTTFSKVTLKVDHPCAVYFGTGKTLTMNRMYYMDETPYIYMEHYFAKDIKMPSKIKDDNGFSLYMFLYQNGYTISHFEDSFTVGIPPQYVIEEMQLSGEPMIVRKRLSYDTSGHVVETSTSYYNTTIHPYQISYDV